MKLATWNVNSLKVRLPHVLQWLAAQQPDVLCLQETKLEDERFPRVEIEEAGYHVLFCGQKAYNGVVILSRRPGVDVVCEIPGYLDELKRVLAATIDGVRVVCLYVPNGQSVGSDKYRYKLEWLAALKGWLQAELSRHPSVAVLGDYNIAPDERDVYDPKAWEGQVLFSLPERQAFQELLQLGLVDSFRLFDHPDKSFTWWDYRMGAFRRNLGLRIDHILLSSPLASKCVACTVDTAPRRLERPSDHAPVVAEINVV